MTIEELGRQITDIAIKDNPAFGFMIEKVFEYWLATNPSHLFGLLEDIWDTKYPPSPEAAKRIDAIFDAWEDNTNERG